MHYVVAITNQKGGVGKTATAVNLAAALGRQKKRSLLLDFDPQGNATSHVIRRPQPEQLTSWHWFEEEHSLEDVVQQTDSGFDLIPSDADLTAVELNLLKVNGRTHRLRDKLNKSQSYEYVIIDCPPSLNILSINALIAATHVLIPLQCEYFALEGLTSLLSTISAIQRSGNAKLRVDGILRTMYDKRNKLSKDVSNQLFKHFPTRTYRTYIPRNVRLAEAPSHGQSIFQYAPSSPGARAYLTLAREMLKRHKR